MSNATRAFSASLVCLLSGVAALAGPITPPPGPVASTFKTLTEVEPRIAINATNTPGDADSAFRIAISGSYYLTGNIIVTAADKHGIEIAASGVTIDLNGFILAGPLGAAFDGVAASAAGLRNIEVRNGTISGFGGDGVDFQAMQASACVVRDLRVRGNSGAGIRVGPASSVIACTVYENSTDGIVADPGCSIASCLSSSNGFIGIRASTGANISGCTANVNGTIGISAGANSRISDCTGASNGTLGIAASNSTFSLSSASGNGTHGFSISSGSTITACTADRNDGNGISGVDDNTISGCTTADNGGEGISVASGNSISGCSSVANTSNGIQVFSRNLVTNNSCTGNGVGDGAGILVLGSYCRLEGNHCTSADRGIDVDGTFSIIIGNTCGDNGVNWTIATGNSYGPIVNASFGASVNGSTAASTLGSTDPHANISR